MSEILRSKWMITAVIVELLGLIAAFGTIPGLGLPVAWMLSATAILSAGGVVIVTVYFLIQYNRRPLNQIQRREIGELLAGYSTRKEIAEKYATPDTAQKLASQVLSEQLLDGLGLYWRWRYQNSVMELARQCEELADRENYAGYVVVAELTRDGVATRMRSWLVPPPTDRVGELQGTDGDELPHLFSDLPSLFNNTGWDPIVIYLGKRGLRCLRGGGKVYWDDRLACPAPYPGDVELDLPRLKSKGMLGSDEREWEWGT